MHSSRTASVIALDGQGICSERTAYTHLHYEQARQQSQSACHDGSISLVWHALPLHYSSCSCVSPSNTQLTFALEGTDWLIDTNVFKSYMPIALGRLNGFGSVQD